MKYLFCAICVKALRRPTANGSVIYFCKSCDRCLEVPSTWPTGFSTTEPSASAATPHESASVFPVPDTLPELTDLGPVLEVHRTESHWWAFSAIIFLIVWLAIVLPLLFYGQLGERTVEFLCYAPLALVLLPLIVIVFFRNWLAPQAILVTGEGLVHVRRRRPEVIRWTHIDEYFESYSLDDNVSPARVRRSDGWTLDFGIVDPANQEKLETRVRKEVWQRIFTYNLALFEEGKVVRCGKIGVCKVGLVRGTRTLPWGQIARVQILDGTFRIRARGSLFFWFSKRINAIPNFFVLKALVETRLAVQQLSRKI